MIYPKDYEEKIGFSSVRSHVAAFCETPMGMALVDAMKFTSNFEEVKRMLLCTDEMRGLLTSGIGMPEDSFYDILPWIKAATAPGSFLSSEKLYYCGVSFTSMRNICLFFNTENSDAEKYKQLREVFQEMPDLLGISREIFRCIDKGGEVKDNASPGLLEVRREMGRVQSSIHKVMDRILSDSIRQGFVDKDVSPAMRDGHLVLPVNAANKKSISGILHDASASGKTFYIEPAEVVEVSNRLRELQLLEQQEIVQILIGLTSLITAELNTISVGCRLLATYDFLRAKARFAIDTGAEMPVLEREPELDWYHAVHPGLMLLLRKQGKEVVPLNLQLNSENRILIISGPNAGGKSITLKTVGTVQYMMQCGLLPTLYSNSHMGVFRNIFIDIGDEQSMENALSTYSSHLANMKFFLQNSSKGTLILADEMGSGTEPQIGAALAQSVLTILGKSGCMGVITTHYQNLKIIAEQEAGFINGAMLFDRQLLSPTFQLDTGHPGSSFALEIAGKIGLPKEVLEMAKEIVGSDYVDSEKFLLDIQRDRRYWKNKRLNIKEKEARLDKILEEYEEKANQLKSLRSDIIKTAREEAKEILAGVNTKIERTIHEIRKSQADKEKSKAVRKDIEEYSKSLQKESETDKVPEVLKPLRHSSKNKKNNSGMTPSSKTINEFKAGDFVKMENGGVVGQIISVSGKRAEVAFGALRTSVDLKKLHSAKRPALTQTNPVISTSSYGDSQSRERQLNFKQEIDVRGMKADEALQAVTYFLDDAVQFNASRLRILHGTGHGILRTLIRDLLKSNPNVSEFRDEDVRFGGAGITVIDLKD